MDTRRLGRTGHDSTLAILGGAAFGRCTPEKAEAGFRLALDAGVNHLDVAPSYGDAERLLGPLVPPVRDRLFLGEKTHRRAPDGVRSQLEETLRRFGTDHVDLYQLHGVTSIDVLDEREAALATIVRARDEGLTRFVGITGHDMTAPAAHLEALRRHDLDTVMFPVNARLWADGDYRRDAEALLETCAARDVGVMAIKAAAARPWSGGAERWADTWYEPVDGLDEVERGVRFALSVPGVHAFCCPGDLDILPHALAAARRFEPMGEADREDESARAGREPLIFPMPV